MLCPRGDTHTILSVSDPPQPSASFNSSGIRDHSTRLLLLRPQAFKQHCLHETTEVTHGVCRGVKLNLDLMFHHHNLEILSNVKQGAPPFHFALSPVGYVASPGYLSKGHGFIGAKSTGQDLSQWAKVNINSNKSD